MSKETWLYFNGINGATGEYGLPPMTSQELAGFITGEIPPDDLVELGKRYFRDAAKQRGVIEGVDPTKLEEAGWGVILPHDADPAIQQALSELLDLRREQAGERFQVYAGEDGLQPGESKTAFLARHGMGPGPVNPEKVPYYLLLVGSPEAIPFRFQYQLDVQYAVGRIHFENIQDYAHYARSVVLAESGQVQLPRRCALFGVTNPDDRATELSTQHLVQPVLEYLQKRVSDWEYQAFLQDDANKAQLQRLLGGDQTPALLFTASHGMEFPLNDSRLIPHQGALLCRDWPGPREWQKDIPQQFYFAGDDLEEDADLLGRITFHFACYGAGTPLLDAFARQAFQERLPQAPHPFVAALPSRLLSHPRGGALAIIGHVDRAWGYSFLWPGAGEQTEVFESALHLLLKGSPVGHAMDYFDSRYAELATVLNEERDDIEQTSRPYDAGELSGIWTANNDARGYVILGDPAVRLPVAKPGEEPQVVRPDLATSVAVSPTPEKPIVAGPPEPEEQALVPAAFDEADFYFAVRQERFNLTDSIKRLTGKLTEALRKAAEEISTLEVKTYVSSDLEAVGHEGSTLTGEVELRAFTRIAFDGDMQVCVPEKKGGGIDMDLWQVHREMVREAQENRTRFLTMMAEMAVKLVELLKP